MRAPESEEDASIPTFGPWAASDEQDQHGRDEIEDYMRRRSERPPRGPPPPAGRALLELKGNTEPRTEIVRREAAEQVRRAAKWAMDTASETVEKGTAIGKEAIGWLHPALPMYRTVDWEKEFFMPEEREKIREWRAQGLRPPLDWDPEIHARVAEYAADVVCKRMKDALQGCYSRNYTTLTAGRCGTRMRWFKQCTRAAVLNVMPDWGNLTAAASLEPEMHSDFDPQNFRWPSAPDPEYYVFPSAALRFELMDAIGDFRMDSLDINAWPLPFLYQFREELGVPDWLFDWPTAFGPSLGPISGQTKHRDYWPNLHSETENWPNQYADEYVSPGMWVNTDRRASGLWRDGLENRCHSRDLYCRSSRQVLKYRMNPWRTVKQQLEPKLYSADQIQSGKF